MGRTLGALAVRHGCELQGDPGLAVDHVATLQDAGPGAISFLANPVYRRHLAHTRATAVILDPREAGACPVAALLTRNPYAAYARIAQDLHPAEPLRPGVHPGALIGPGCTVPASCEIGPGVVLGEGTLLGGNVRLGPYVVVGAGVTIGADTRVHAGVTICAGVRIGRRCILHPGAVIGADGFGFAREQDGSYSKVPQVGSVIVCDDVEIGANTTIDRGAIGDTCIHEGVKLDNQVQVGHNVSIGPHTVIAGQCGISGSTVIGARCVIGGQVGIAGHITLADDVVIAGGSGVTGSIRQPGIYGGGPTPADDIQKWRRNMVRFGQLDDIVRRLRNLEQRSGSSSPAGDG